MFNNSPIIVKLAEEPEDPTPHFQAIPRQRVRSEPCLPLRLPSTAFLQRDAEQSIPKTMTKQQCNPSSPELPNTEENIINVVEHSPTSAMHHPDISPPIPKPTQDTKPAKRLSFWKAVAGKKPKVDAEPSSWDVRSAIDRKDLMYLMEVRDRAFHLLLQWTGDATPLLYCMRLGPSHQDVTIVLLGSFSRWINHLPDDQMTLPKTKGLLRALRINLKLAIDYGLQSSQVDLIASFMQTLIMSEGDIWVQSQVASIAGALRTGTDGRPVKRAEDAVRSFATKQLDNAQYISGLEDYIANATSDLVMMAAWHCALNLTKSESIPTWYFARDDRVYKAFIEQLEHHATVINNSAGRRLRWQFRVLRTVMEGNAKNYHQKVNALAKELDNGPAA